MEKLTIKNAFVDLLGRAVIPRGTQEICPKAFDGNRALKSIRVPGSVKKIGSRAFADCPNLKSVILEEGIEEIEGNVFTGCTALQELVLPDSIRNLDGWAFYRFTGLQTPAYNRSGTILYCYPCTAQTPVFTLPSHVKKINAAAFLNNPHLQQVNLPQGLQLLERRTFLDCGIQRVVIPPSVKQVETQAFWNCKNLQEVVILGERTVIDSNAFFRCPWEVKLTTPHHLRFDERLHLFGAAFLQPVRLEYPHEPHWENPEFMGLAKACAAGDAAAMWALADFFCRLGEQPFYTCAANFWRYRACQYGCEDAALWLERHLKEHPERNLPSTLDEHLEGSYSGRRLRGTGFLFFDPERSYCLTARDAAGVVEVSSWCGDEGPDEDGFGREECYDWWFLDEHLNPIPGVDVIHNFSRIDKRANEKLFRTRHALAAATIKK